MLDKIDRLTERQNQGNLMTQSRGSKIINSIGQDCQTTEEQTLGWLKNTIPVLFNSPYLVLQRKVALLMRIHCQR